MVMGATLFSLRDENQPFNVGLVLAAKHPVAVLKKGRLFKLFSFFSYRNLEVSNTLICLAHLCIDFGDLRYNGLHSILYICIACLF